jgi:hypothetical protein
MPTNLIKRLLELGPSRPGLVSEAYWANSVLDDANLLMAAVEYKKFNHDDAYRQLVFHLSTAQSAYIESAWSSGSTFVWVDFIGVAWAFDDAPLRFLVGEL